MIFSCTDLTRFLPTLKLPIVPIATATSTLANAWGTPRSLLPGAGASICIVPLSQPCPVSFYF